jgi:hypothetical protein
LREGGGGTRYAAGVDGAALLEEAQRLLDKHAPESFDTTVDAFPECIEIVRRVEDEGAWSAVYPSLNAFYVAHERRHPDIKVYAEAGRRIEQGRSPGGTGNELLRRLRTRRD